MDDPLLQIFVVFLLVFLNAFFVSAEFAIVKVSGASIEKLARKGNRRAKVALLILRHMDTYLSACQVGITLASLGLGWVGEPFLARLLFPLFHAAGVGSDTVVHTVSFVIAFSIITFLHIVLGEMAPKSFAIRRPTNVAIQCALPLRLFYLLFLPAIRVLNGSAILTLRAFGLPMTEPFEHTLSVLEMRDHFSKSAERGEMTPHQTRMLERVLDFHGREAHQIMVPRTDMVVLSAKSDAEENLKTAEECGFTRFPLCEGSIDRIIGFVHAKDLYRATRKTKGPVNLRSLKRGVLFFPEHNPLETILEEFQQKKVHLGIVLDEYGGTLGMLTLEDVIEELVGEIQDEFDREEPHVQRVGRYEFLLDGGCPVAECGDLTGVALPETGADTVAGVLLDTVGDLPKIGTRMELEGAILVVEELEEHRITRIRLIRDREKEEKNEKGD